MRWVFSWFVRSLESLIFDQLIVLNCLIVFYFLICGAFFHASSSKKKKIDMDWTYELD